ncbi:MAG TPA: RdgB/HAM1 family non-canonical purine NTP pyrophosphatase [Cyclobacteriaceae bacterium]|nr:RdgB/HAM1 family non-canonical purine NTP pyrophosphatase [Cyclobacteriaceae bacterium]HPW63025.1 RdgB/HAM1 family non-canonical purine NTP pyrophosphatase [Cyclobacteriaceae bacterium]
MTICFATNNEHKLKEIRALLGNEFRLVGLAEVGCNEELAEDQTTLEGNSLQKAEYVFRKSGTSCFADDTGLEVEVLNNEPGVFSARYAGEQRSAEDNMNLLLKNLSGKDNRNARFRTVITLITPEGIRQFEGEVHGKIIDEKRGTEGFGYDPIFLPDGFSKTLAEMTLEEKSAISHRARAFKKLIAYLKGRKTSSVHHE